MRTKIMEITQNEFTFYQTSPILMNKFGPDVACVHAVIWNRSKTEGYECKLSEPMIGNELHITYKRVEKALHTLIENGYIKLTEEVNEYGTKSYKYVPEMIANGLREEEKVTLKSNDARIRDPRGGKKRKRQGKASMKYHHEQCDKPSQTDVTNYPSKKQTNETNHIGINNYYKDLNKKILNNVISKNNNNENNGISNSCGLEQIESFKRENPPTESDENQQENTLNKSEDLKEHYKKIIDTSFKKALRCQLKEKFLSYHKPVFVNILTCDDIHKLELFAKSCEKWNEKVDNLHIELIKEKIQNKFHILADDNRWNEFCKFVAEREEKHNQPVNTFINWFLKREYDIVYMTPEKLRTIYPQAFFEQEQWEKNFVPKTYPPEEKTKNYVPMPDYIKNDRLKI